VTNTRRVSSVSGKPPENFEEIQVVKYEKGGFFKVTMMHVMGMKHFVRE
jgi:hypothetical protein